MEARQKVSSDEMKVLGHCFYNIQNMFSFHELFRNYDQKSRKNVGNVILGTDHMLMSICECNRHCLLDSAILRYPVTNN